MVIAVVIVAVVSSGSGRSATSTTIAGPPVAPSTTVASGTGSFTGLSLKALMPDQAGTSPAGNLDLGQCVTVSPYPAGLTGVSDALDCSTIPGLSKWELFGYKFDGASSYNTSLASYNKDKGFVPSSATNSCPPPGGSGAGQIGWHDTNYPQQPSGQVIECLKVSSPNSPSQPTYIWTAPTQDAFFEMIAATNASFTDLDNWWTKNGGVGHP
ncbi:MAG: hypothetical protein M3Y91_04650 [Actinomycetota bacterium]|nr:hypothetical protein [Actinomycetota bacterium]